MAGLASSRSLVEMETRCNCMASDIMGSTRSAGGVRLGGARVRLLGHRILLAVALLFVMVTTFRIEDVECSVNTDAVFAPAPVPTATPLEYVVTFNQFEAEAMNAILQKWSKQNPQLSTLFNWTVDQHPCNNLTSAFDSPPGTNFNGAWYGVECSSVLRNSSETPRHYEIQVTSLRIFGWSYYCQTTEPVGDSVCGFQGIIGQLPLEISKLTNLNTIRIYHNPQLTGPVPTEIFQLPNLHDLGLGNNSLSGTLPSDVNYPYCQLEYLDLSNNYFSGNLRASPQGTLFCLSLRILILYRNSLNGTIPSNIYNGDCKLEYIYLSYNNFSGGLQLSSQGTLFCSSLMSLHVEFNQLHGPINFQYWNSSNAAYLYLHNNYFNGTFSTGPYFDANYLDLSNNDLSSIQFAKYIGSTRLRYSSLISNIYIPGLYFLNISCNNISGLFPKEIFGMISLEFLDLSLNNFFGSIDSRGLNNSMQLEELYINNNNFNGTFFTSAYLNPRIMDLSSNHFNTITFDEYIENTFPNGSLFISRLQEVYFQNNSFEGQFPAHVLNSRLKILKADQNQYATLQLPIVKVENYSFFQISITNNKLSSVKYSAIGPFMAYNLQYSSLLFLGGNPICNKIENLVTSSVCRLHPLDEAPPVIQKTNAKVKIIIATSTSSIFVVVLLITTIYVWRLMRRIKSLHIILEEFEKKEVKPNLYSYREIKLATNNFDKGCKLGEGGFGVVYKGELFDGTLAAVKKLTMSSNQGLSEFLNEVIVISGLKHRNLVKLKGCCLGDGDQRILVFEYVENKNLAEALWIDGDLQNNIQLPCLNWGSRFNIIVGIARGLIYLHEDLQPPIIHRDIKATNILLDKDYNPKIADFGLAYLFQSLDNEASHLTLTEVGGTRGYCSPEYALHGHISTALDVYSFGILMLEIVSGRKNIDLQKPSEEIYLREWAWRQYEAKTTMTLIDANMDHAPSDLNAIMRVITVALACVQYKAAKRPQTCNILSMLFGNIPISKFRNGFEDGEASTKVNEESLFTLGTTSSLWSNENLHIDDCCLLRNIDDIEMISMVR